MVDLEARIRTLERRLAREVAARQEAESIAEGGMRELWERKRSLRLLESVATAANQQDAAAPTFALALERICEFTGWRVGHVYMLRRRRGVPSLTSTRLWRMHDGWEGPEFLLATRDLHFVKGVGLPGRVLQTGQPLWVPDLQADDNFLRRTEAQATGLRAGFGFPVLIGGEVVAMLEFYADRVTPRDEAIVQLMGQLCGQLGRVLERARTAQLLRRRNGALRGVIAHAEAQQHAAEAANRAKSAFLAMTSHEVRTPLNAVMGLAHALAREPLTPAQMDLVEGVTDAGAMLLRLLNSVLDISRVERGDHAAELAPFDPRRALAALQRIWRPRAEEMAVGLRFEASGLPDDCIVVSDQGKVEQTLINLISNALKFSPPRGVVTIAAHLFPAGHPGRARLRLEVLDEGPGVSEADRERIFQPFEQTKEGRQAGGIGLGLAISAANVTALGGAIGQDRASCGRNRFWFEFEAELGEAPTLTTEPSAAPITALRVLAAEDNAANRRVLKVLLEPFEVDLTFAHDGLEALEAIRSHAFDVILMDANMPRMDGVEALRQIRREAGPAATTPAYMLTANVYEEDIRRYMQAGADGVLTKPVQVDKLLDLLAAIGEPDAVHAA